ncbi:hypothetical protein KY284_036641 [Solanum tuberosum]|nr:hypothetical protein KY284_036641 [Solanum tuberosum]
MLLEVVNVVSCVPKMVLVDLVFHYCGEWIRGPKLLYERKLVHKWEGYVSGQQLIISVPSGKYYEIEELEVPAQERRRHYTGVRVKTLKGEHKCDDPCDNYKISATTIAFYFKEKLQANLKYKIKKMRVDLKTTFNINAHFEKCKRAKRMFLEDMEGSFCDDYKKLVGYANALKESNPGTDVVLKGKAKCQLLGTIGQDSMNHFYPIAWAIVDKECKASWLWFFELLQKSLNINSGEGITFMSDMQKAPLYKNLYPLEEIHWWYSKEAYLLTYHCKLQSVPGQNLIKIVKKALLILNSLRVRSKSSPIAATVEDFPLTAPQPTQDCASEDEDFGLDVEDDMPWKPRDFSELKSRIQQRQNKHKLLDQEESTLILMMDMRSNKEKKQANENRTLIDEEDIEDFPLTSPKPTQDCASDEDEDFGLDVEDDKP